MRQAGCLFLLVSVSADAGCLLSVVCSALQIDSFEYLGIKDFAAFGFDLVPVEVPGVDAATGKESRESTVLAFKHITKAQWILGVRLPQLLALRADGQTTPHTDGKGWKVDVAVEHPIVGLIVAYNGNVRLT